MTQEQITALVKLLDLSVHSQVGSNTLAHEYKVELLDRLHALKAAFGLALQPENEPE